MAKALGGAAHRDFLPGFFGLLPGHLHWANALPIEGLSGRLVEDWLVEYLNFPGAAIVIVSMVAVAIYLSTTFSFNTAREWLAIRLAFFYAWRDRLRNWRVDRQRTRAEKQRMKLETRREKDLIKAQKAASKAEEKTRDRRLHNLAKMRTRTSRPSAAVDSPMYPATRVKPSLTLNRCRSSGRRRYGTRCRAPAFLTRFRTRFPTWSRSRPWRPKRAKIATNR